MHVRPGRRVRVLEVGHEDVRAGVERVDHHLALDRAGDLDAAVAQVAGASAHRQSDSRTSRVSCEEVRQLARAQASGALVTRGEELLAAGIQLAVEAGNERDRLGVRISLARAGSCRASEIDCAVVISTFFQVSQSGKTKSNRSFRSFA